MNLKEIERQQSELLAGVFEVSNTPASSEAVGALKEVIKYDTSFLEYALPELGAVFKKFAEELDLTHPDIRDIGPFTGMEEGSLSRELVDHFRLTEFIRDNNISGVTLYSMIQRIKRLLSDESINLGSTSLCARKKARFVKGEREALRSLSNSQRMRVELNGALPPADLTPIGRGKNVFQDELSEAEKCKKNMLRLNLSSMAQEAQRVVDSVIKRQQDQSYYGFNQVTMEEVSLHLAAAMDYEVLMNGLIRVYSDTFGSFRFYDSELLFAEVKYEPIALPYLKLKESISPEMDKVIHRLDYFPEACHKPIFDEFWVVLPLLELPPYQQKFPFTYIDQGGKTMTFGKEKADSKMESYHKAQCQLATILLKNSLIVGALIGQRDDKDYFICYWK